LQSRGEVSGHDLSQLVEVDERSIRRYIMLLRDMGIPIEAVRGRGGGYMLQHGFRLPPLMFNNDEITAVTIGLMLMRELGSTSSLAVESAAAKIERVLPDELHEHTLALRESLMFDHVNLRTVAIADEYLLTFSRALSQEFCLDISYQSGDGEMSQRRIAPYGLGLYARTWYVVAYCYLREDMRVFRLDRVRSAVLSPEKFTRPADFDTRAFIFDWLAHMGGTYTCEILLDAPLEVAREVIPVSLGILENVGDKTLLRCYTDSPAWLARYLMRFEVSFKVLQPEELRAALRTLADEIRASTG
ncbi:MAG: YafY family protein, partial [Chloroflexota bacterium]